MKILVVYYSMYGHVFKLAQEAKRGAEQVSGAEVLLKRIPETLPAEVLGKMGAIESLEKQKDIPICNIMDLKDADAVLFGTPTRFGNMCGQMRQFLDAGGKLWVQNALVGKVAGVFCSSSTQHGGQESTLLSFHITLLHLGFIVAGLPYSFTGQNTVEEISGCSPYGASTIAGGKNDRIPTENELAGARFQGRYIAEIAAKLIR